MQSLITITLMFATVMFATVPSAPSSQKPTIPSAPQEAQNQATTANTSPASRAWKCGMSGPPTVAFIGKSIVWIDYSAGKVVKAPVGGGTATVVASNQDGACAITADESNVYWTNTSQGTVTKLPLNGGPPVVLARDQRHPSEIGLSGNYVAWMTADGPHMADSKTRDTKAGNVVKMAGDDSNAGSGTNPGTVKCHVCPIYCKRFVPQIPKGYWESYICGWRSCPPCGA
jgi:hypothetical protein